MCTVSMVSVDLRCLPQTIINLDKSMKDGLLYSDLSGFGALHKKREENDRHDVSALCCST